MYGSDYTYQCPDNGLVLERQHCIYQNNVNE